MQPAFIDRARTRAHPAGFRPALALGGLTFCLLVGAARPPAAPIIGSTSAASLERSGRLLVFGSEFGAGGPGSSLEIDGQPAIATTWTSTEIHAYVPEASSLGSVSVQVVTGSGVSNAASLDVLPRVSQGRTQWRFQLDSNYAGLDVGVGANGRLYTTDDQRLYALTADGGLRWVLPGAGAGHPVAVDASGVVYTYAGGVVAVSSDGTLLWKFVPPAPNDQVIAGPSIGPDGNIYVVQDTSSGGLGVFSLDPGGNLRWSDKGSPVVFNSGGAAATEIFFAPLAEDRLVFGNGGALQGLPPLLYGFTLSGEQRWTYSSGCSSFPAIDAQGRAFVANSGSCGVTAIESQAGSVVWNASPPSSIQSTVRPAVGPDGTIYGGDFAGKLWALRPDGSTRWFTSAPLFVSKLAISPDGSTLVEGQTEVRGFDVDDGALLWEVPLLVEQGFAQLVNTAAGPSFSPGGDAAYITTRFTGSGPGYSYLQAVGVSESNVVSYCTAGASASGCTAAIAAAGTPSASSASGFFLTAAGVEGGKDGVFFFGTQGRQANAWGNGTSLQCVVPPVLRAGLLLGSGSAGACDGMFSQDLNTRWAAKPAQNPGAGTVVQAQLWYRDPASTSNRTTSLSDALEFTVGL